jgi:hypothetical protein
MTSWRPDGREVKDSTPAEPDAAQPGVKLPGGVGTAGALRLRGGRVMGLVVRQRGRERDDFPRRLAALSVPEGQGLTECCMQRAAGAGWCRFSRAHAGTR